MSNKKNTKIGAKISWQNLQTLYEEVRSLRQQLPWLGDFAKMVHGRRDLGDTNTAKNQLDSSVGQFFLYPIRS